jgi:hypothetical protein
MAVRGSCVAKNFLCFAAARFGFKRSFLGLPAPAAAKITHTEKPCFIFFSFVANHGENPKPIGGVSYRKLTLMTAIKSHMFEFPVG